MQPQIQAANATLGAIITGLNLAELDDDRLRVIEEAFIEYAVLVFPGQHLSDDAQAAFAERLGDIEYFGDTRKLIPLTNVAEDGTLLDPNGNIMRMFKGNQLWHTDSSFKPLSSKASMLSAHVIPQSGGQTEWADMRAAYDALDSTMRERIKDLAAYHSIAHSQAKLGHKIPETFGYGLQDDDPPLRPLVKAHPDTGRRSLFIGRHAYGIPGLDEQDSDALLEELNTFACQPPRIFSHAWRVGDIAVWDNRCVLHRGRPFDYQVPRLMKHTRIKGNSSEQAMGYE